MTVEERKKRSIVVSLKFQPVREAALGDALRELGHRVVAVAFSRRWATFAEHSEGFDMVYDFTKFLQNTKRGGNLLSVASFAEAEARYGLPSAAQLISMDRVLRQREYGWASKVLAEVVAFLELIFTNEEPSAFVGELSSAPDLIAWHLAAWYRVPYLNMMHSRLWDDRFAIVDTKGMWEDLKQVYAELRTSCLDAQTKKRLRMELERYRREEPQPSYMRELTKKRRTQFRDVLENLFIKVISYPVDRRFGIDYPVSLWKKYYLEIAVALRKYVTRVRRLFDEPREGDRYILFPLHFQPEATTMVFAPFFENQYSVVENLAKALPTGYVLYVKEHKAMWGRRRIRFYRELKRLSPIRLIAPWHNIHHLIRNASCVVVITSTTGLEAILHGKRVVVLGNIFYQLFDCVRSVERLQDLPDHLREAVQDDKVDEEEIVTILAALEKASHPGYVDSRALGKGNRDRMLIGELARFVLKRAEAERDRRCIACRANVPG